MERKCLLGIFTPFISIGLFLMCACTDTVTLSDWPQFKKDNYRSGYAEADLDLSNFGLLWMFDTKQEPIPAWYGPAKEDAYARSGALPSMRDYDLSYYPIVVGNSLYYASSADDAVHCHDASNGRERWHFTTGAPIRIAPTYYKGKIYVGSDDGYVYCIDSYSGKLKWKFNPVPDSEMRLLNNGRFISFYPVRTGVMIEDGIAYFGASLLPWKKSYICAIDANRGVVGPKGTYVKEYETNFMTLEGAMASTGKLLIQPQGRIAPVFINKENGETEGQLAGTGGCFVLVTPEKNIVHNNTPRYIGLSETKIEDKQPEFMSYNGGKEIVVKGDETFVLNDNSLVSYNRKTQEMNWLRQNFFAQRIIVVGDVLFAGTSDRIAGISLKNGQTVWSSEVKGTVYALSFAQNKLFASTAEGYLYAFARGGKGADFFPENFDKMPVVDNLKTEEEKCMKQSLRDCISAGPYIQPYSVDSVRLTFYTYEPMKIGVDWGINGDVLHCEASKASCSHSFCLPVRKGLNYDYRLKDGDGKIACYNYDNFFNFFTRDNYDFPYAGRGAEREIEEYLKRKKVYTGLCLTIGEGSGEMALALAKLTPLKVVNIESSGSSYNYFVEQLQEKQSYGRKLSALKVKDNNNIPLISELADLVWICKGENINPDEVIRLIAPNQYAVVTGLKDCARWLSRSTIDWQVSVDKESSDEMLILKKNPIENIGVWTHQHGDMRNASYGGESLYGSTQTSDFETQWMGRPGARFITDRSGRKPAPLAVDGRMFVQGKERIAAVNIYNGSLLWMKDIPGLLRMNVPRDCSNWACDNDYLYVAARQYLLKIDQKSGDIVQTLDMHMTSDSINNWGYIGVTNNAIIGSTTVKDAQFVVYHGGGDEGWYDSWEGPNVYKVLSNRIFSVDKVTERLTWEYIPKGVIINPTIASYDGKMLFVESFSANKESRKTGRGGNDLYRDTRLVALDINTGSKLYEKRFSTIEGRTVYFMAANTGKCVVVSSFNREYDIQAFDIETGNEVWSAKQNWFHSDHGAHMSKPAIAGDRLVVKPAVYNLHTGEQEEFNMPKAGHGCAHYALSDNAVFYRGASCTMFDFNTRLFSKWERLRPDCWLSTVPAQGMILSPEAGGGCSCGLWYETSMVFAPISRAPVMIKAYTDAAALDYKNETWGNFTSECNTNEFKDSLLIELHLKPGVEAEMYYTVDGSEPGKQSQVYFKPFTLFDSAVVKVAVFIVKGGKERKFVRTRFYERIYNEENEVHN